MASQAAGTAPADGALRTPVALIIFNRPQATARVIAAIARARPQRLLVIADGPRADRPGEAELCARARALVDTIDWPCQVQRHYAAENLGCKLRIATGLDWVFSQVAEAIVVEDDCVPDPTFFRFCEELLERHRDDERVHMISGCNLLGGRRFGRASYYFSRFYHIWGWATWARAWKHYDVTMSRWPQVRDTGWLERFLPTAPMVERARYIFEETHRADRFSTWDYQWVFSGWQRGALAIVPATNLVENIGYGADATHTQAEDRAVMLARRGSAPMRFPLRHPRRVQPLDAADRCEWDLLNRPPAPGFVARLRARLGRLRPSVGR